MCPGPSSAAPPAPSPRRRRHRTSAMSSSSINMLPSSRLSVSSSSTSSTSFSASIMPRDSVSGVWMDDAACSACTKCDRPFSLVTRRHHCRICGQIFCGPCSRTRMMLQTSPAEPPRRQRVCDNCVEQARTSLSGTPPSDLDARSESNSSLSSAGTEVIAGTETDVVVVEETTSSSETILPGSSFRMASMVCFAAAFWFLKDEVSYSNPAIWILLAGFMKNLHELVLCVRHEQRKKTVTAHSRSSSTLHKPAAKSSASSSAETVSESSDVVQPAKEEDVLQLPPGKENELLDIAESAMDKVWELGMNDDGWTSEQPAFGELLLYSRDFKPVRIYKCDAVIDLSPDDLFEVLYNQFEQSSVWNVTAAENKILKKLDEATDIVHLITAPALGGMVTSRDFVNTRKWRRQEGGYLIASTCAGKNLVKTSKGIVRGQNGPTGFIILPHEESPNKCRFIWVLNCDIKGYFPGSVIRKGTLSEICCFVRNLRRHLAETNGSESQ